MKKVFSRLLDVALIAALVYGGPDARTFAFWVITLMVPVLSLGVFAMDVDLAEKIHGRAMFKKAINVSIHCAYVAALIYAGFPVLAALYATVAVAIRAAAETKLAAQEQH